MTPPVRTPGPPVTPEAIRRAPLTALQGWRITLALDYVRTRRRTSDPLACADTWGRLSAIDAEIERREAAGHRAPPPPDATSAVFGFLAGAILAGGARPNPDPRRVVDIPPDPEPPPRRAIDCKSRAAGDDE